MKLFNSYLSLIDCAITWFWMGEIKIFGLFSTYLSVKTPKKGEIFFKKEYKYVPLWCHEIPEARTSWAGVLRSSFLLKTLSHCSAFCQIWNQLNSILDLDQLLKLVHSHKALSCSKKGEILFKMRIQLCDIHSNAHTLKSFNSEMDNIL